MRTEPGGLSGKPLFGLSTLQLAKLFVLTKGAIPLVGAGGIHDANTAWMKLCAGATLLQLYSALVYRGPALVTDILDVLSRRLRLTAQSLEAIRGRDAEAIVYQGSRGT